MANMQASLLLLAIVVISAATSSFVPNRPSPRSYAFSYASPDGKHARYESAVGSALDGGYKYVTPDGGLVAVRYSNDPSGQRAPPLTATERRFSAATGALVDPYGDRDPSRRSTRRHAFSYVLPDGHSRYESWEDGEVVGGYRYVSPDGTKVAVRYTAGADGFRPVDVSSEVRTGPLAVGVQNLGPAFPTARAVVPVPQIQPIPQVQPVQQVAAAYPTVPVQTPINPYYIWRHLDDDDHDDWDDDDHLTAYRRVVYPVPAAPVTQQLPVYSYPAAAAAAYYASQAYQYPVQFPYVRNPTVFNPYLKY